MGVFLKHVNSEPPKDHHRHHAHYTDVKAEAQRGEEPPLRYRALPAVAGLWLEPRPLSQGFFLVMTSRNPPESPSSLQTLTHRLALLTASASHPIFPCLIGDPS